MTGAFRSTPAWLARPSESLRYIVYCRMFAAGSVVHLTLPDALADEWLPANLAYWAGAFLLAVNGSLLAWLLCAVGLALPLLLYQDQLTQSVYLLGCALGAIGCWLGPARDRSRRMGVALPAVVRVLTVGTYGLAALHKLNRDFLDPAVSCATGGMHILAENWGIAAIAPPSLDGVWPHLFLATEILVVVLLVVRPAAGMLLALAMHIPLTIVFAPAFAFVMIPGWTCLLGERELLHLGETLRARWRWIVGIGGALGVGSFALYMRTHWIVYPFWSAKEVLLWIAAVWLLVAWARRPDGVLGWWSAWRERIPPSRRWLVVTLGALWLANGLTPYTGLQVHHAGAMLSNLRIDESCWNSLVFPESMRIVDPYVRIDEARVGDVPGRDELTILIRDRLWNTRSLWRESREWCEAGAAPLRVRGTHRGEPFTADDLCDPSQWPFSRPLLPGFRPYQEDLSRHCPQSCIH